MAWAAAYYVTGAAPYTAVSATFTVPALTASSVHPATCALWAGLDGQGSGTVEQCGIACFVDPSQAVRYQAWCEYFPADQEFFSPVAYPVRQGDSVTAAVAYSGARSGSYTCTVVNSTRGWTATVTKTQAALTLQNATLPVLYSAEIAIEADQPENQLSNFGTVTFTGITGLGSSPSSTTTAQATISSAWSGSSPNGTFAATWAHA